MKQTTKEYLEFERKFGFGLGVFLGVATGYLACLFVNIHNIPIGFIIVWGPILVGLIGLIIFVLFRKPD
jgi:hypothetical protein